MIWRKSSRCAANGTCVELAAMPNGVAFRDSKFPEQPYLTVPGAVFSNLVRSIKGSDEAR